MKVRMLIAEKLGKVYDVPDAKAADLIARGIAEAWEEPAMTTTSADVIVRRRRFEP